MKNNFLHKRAMYGKVGNFFDANEQKLISSDPVTAEMESFKTRKALLEEKAEQHSKDTTHLYLQKALARNEWMSQLLVSSRIAHGWALRNKPEIAQQLNISMHDLLSISEEDGADLGKNTLAILRENVEEIKSFGVTLASLDALAVKIAAYENLIPNSAEAISHKKRLNDDIVQLVKDIDSSLYFLDALIAGTFAADDPELVSEYKVMRKIGKAAHRATGLRITLRNKDGTSALEGVKAVIRELGRTTVSNINGIAEFLRFKTGTYHLDFYVANAVVHTEQRKIPRGEVVELNVEL